MICNGICRGQCSHRPKAFPSGEGCPASNAGYVSRAFLTRLMQTQREADEGWGAQRHTMQLVECSIPSSVCSASRRSHLPPREGFLADEGIGPYDLLPAFQRKILAQGKI